MAVVKFVNIPRKKSQRTPHEGRIMGWDKLPEAHIAGDV